MRGAHCVFFSAMNALGIISFFQCFLIPEDMLTSWCATDAVLQENSFPVRIMVPQDDRHRTEANIARDPSSQLPFSLQDDQQIFRAMGAVLRNCRTGILKVLSSKRRPLSTVFLPATPGCPITLLNSTLSLLRSYRQGKPLKYVTSYSRLTNKSP